jgi:hypothetical protein
MLKVGVIPNKVIVALHFRVPIQALSSPEESVPKIGRGVYGLGHGLC